MTQPNQEPNSPEIDQAIRDRLLARVKGINRGLLARLRTAADDLDQGNHLAAFGALDGIERAIDSMRSLLSLLR